MVSRITIVTARSAVALANDELTKALALYRLDPEGSAQAVVRAMEEMHSAAQIIVEDARSAPVLPLPKREPSNLRPIRDPFVRPGAVIDLVKGTIDERGPKGAA